MPKLAGLGPLTTSGSLARGWFPRVSVEQNEQKRKKETREEEDKENPPHTTKK
jgi:hypothetical protein